jgi:hypothetical protein
VAGDRMGVEQSCATAHDRVPAGNLSQMADYVRASGARPIILTVLPVDRKVFPGAQSKVTALNNAIKATAKSISGPYHSFIEW